MPDHRVAADEGRPLDAGGVRHRGALVGPLGGPGPLPGDLAHHPALEGIPIGLEVALDAADVAPVAPADRRPEGVLPPQHLREHVMGPVGGLPLEAVVEHRGLDDVEASVDLVAEDLAPGRLFQEALDPTVGGGDHHPVVEGIGDPRQHQGGLGAVVAMEGDHLGQVDVGERVAADHYEGLIQEARGILDAAGRAQGEVFDHILQLHPELGTVTEVVADAGPEVLQGDDHLGDAMAPQQPEHVLHAGPPDHRDQRLGTSTGERTQPAALASSHHDRLHRSMS